MKAESTKAPLVDRMENVIESDFVRHNIGKLFWHESEVPEFPPHCPEDCKESDLYLFVTFRMAQDPKAKTQRLYVAVNLANGNYFREPSSNPRTAIQGLLKVPDNLPFRFWNDGDSAFLP